MPRTLFLILLIALLTASPVIADADADEASTATESTKAESAEAPEQPQPLTDAELKQRVERLIDDFADPEYAVREAASAAMRELMREPADARRAMPLLAAHHGSSRDAEVRARIGEVADRYFNQHVLPNYYQQPSFLGISASQTDLPDGQRAISVERVIEDTGAERGGLQTGDFIVGIDGKRFGAGYTVTDFTNDMRQRGVGTKLTFTIVRPPDFETTRDHKITMGAIPDEFLSEADLATRATQTEGLHERWWNQAFLQGRVTLPEDAPTTTAAPNEE